MGVNSWEGQSSFSSNYMRTKQHLSPLFASRNYLSFKVLYCMCLRGLYVWQRSGPHADSMVYKLTAQYTAAHRGQRGWVNTAITLTTGSISANHCFHPLCLYSLSPHLHLMGQSWTGAGGDGWDIWRAVSGANHGHLWVINPDQWGFCWHRQKVF